MKKRKILYILLLTLIVAGSAISATLQEERQYETAVFTQKKVGGFANVPVDEIFAYSYNSESNTWTLIPFQIDEQIFVPDPLSSTGQKKWFYFPPPDTSNNGIFDSHDELVFMVKDLGDWAPRSSWIDNADARIHDRLQMRVYHPQDGSKQGYLYLYQSSTLSRDDIPRPYNMTFDEQTETISSAFYDFQFGDPGLIETVVLKQGNQRYDILDRLKARVNGVFNTSFGPIELTLNEEIMGSQDVQVTPDPIVRMIHQANYKLMLPGLDEIDNIFTVKTKFYPYTGTIYGGDTLTPATIAKHMEDPIEIRFKDLRFSWDFNENATGMKFYSKYNDGITVDGVPDNVNKTIDRPASAGENVSLWGLTTGTPGSVFTYGRFANSTWDDIELYYYDNKDGGQADDDIFNTPETGDGMSYGDYGMLFMRDVESDTIDFTLDFTLQMMPVQNADWELGDLLARNLEDTLLVNSDLITEVDDETGASLPSGIQLYQNYPNPFNNSTQIRFDLDRNEHVKLVIYDSNGRLVSTLINSTLNAGPHTLHWSGVNNRGVEVPSGVYFYQLDSDHGSLRHKLVLIR